MKLQMGNAFQDAAGDAGERSPLSNACARTSVVGSAFFPKSESSSGPIALGKIRNRNLTALGVETTLWLQN